MMLLVFCYHSNRSFFLFEFPAKLGVRTKGIKKHRVTIPCKRSFDFTWNPHEIWQISWNPADFRWNLANFMWNPPKLKSFCWNIWIYKVLGGFHLKSAGFHLKSTGFHHEICRISWIMSFCVMIKYRSFDFRKTNNLFIGISNPSLQCSRWRYLPLHCRGFLHVCQRRNQDFPWGRQLELPMKLSFIKYVCQNGRIGTLRGREPAAPPGSTNVFVFTLQQNQWSDAQRAKCGRKLEQEKT